MNRMRLFKAGLIGAGCLTFLAGCDGLNFQTARQAANADNTADNGPVLLEFDASLINEPLNRDVAGIILPQPGMNRPIPAAPDVRDIERLLFAQSESDGDRPSNYALAYSSVELDVLAQSGARGASPLARQALTANDDVHLSSAPISIAQELINLARMGIRTTWR